MRVECLRLRASPSGKASAFQADIHGFESRRPLLPSQRAFFLNGGKGAHRPTQDTIEGGKKAQ